MIIKTSYFVPSRRQFLLNVLPAGTLFCLGCSNLLFSAQSEKSPKAPPEKHKFLTNSGMNYKQVFEFAYQDSFIPLIQNLANDIGREKFIEMLKKASSEAGANRAKTWAKEVPKNGLVTFTAILRKPNRFWKHTCTHELIEDTAEVVEVKYTECLWAKTFRGANALDIGYAALCHGDFAIARAFNPKIRLIRTKTLMQGDDCCNHRYVWEG